MLPLISPEPPLEPQEPKITGICAECGGELYGHYLIDPLTGERYCPECGSNVEDAIYDVV